MGASSFMPEFVKPGMRLKNYATQFPYNDQRDANGVCGLAQSQMSFALPTAKRKEIFRSARQIYAAADEYMYNGMLFLWNRETGA